MTNLQSVIVLFFCIGSGFIIGSGSTKISVKSIEPKCFIQNFTGYYSNEDGSSRDYYYPGDSICTTIDIKNKQYVTFIK